MCLCIHGAALKLRLIEQACGCCKVRGGADSTRCRQTQELMLARLDAVGTWDRGECVSLRRNRSLFTVHHALSVTATARSSNGPVLLIAQNTMVPRLFRVTVLSCGLARPPPHHRHRSPPCTTVRRSTGVHVPVTVKSPKALIRPSTFRHCPSPIERASAYALGHGASRELLGRTYKPDRFTLSQRSHSGPCWCNSWANNP